MNHVRSRSMGQTCIGYLFVVSGILLLFTASYYTVKGFSQTTSSLFSGLVSESSYIRSVSFSGQLNMNGSGIYNVSEIEVDTVNASQISVHTNALIESIGGSPLIISSALYMLLESLGNLILNPSGNVGIKTSSPSTELDVNGTITSTALYTNRINNDTYYCSTLSDITNSISSIGTGGGTIVIAAGTISVTSTIKLNGGGSYVITGQGADTILMMNDGITVFNVTSAASCVIENLKIDSASETSEDTDVIMIDEGSNNPVTIRNILIKGDKGYGHAIDINSDYAGVFDTLIDGAAYGISAVESRITIENNVVKNLGTLDASAGGTAASSVGIYSGGEYNLIKGNRIFNILGGNGGDGSSGPGGTGSYTVGIYTAGEHTSVIGNIVFNITGGNGGDGDNADGGQGGATQGICIASNSHYSVCEGNIVHTINGGNGGNAGGDNNNGGTAQYTFGIMHYRTNRSVCSDNTIHAIQGGDGGNGSTVGGTGGNGGSGRGINFQTSSYSTIRGNSVTDCDGGDGGTGGVSSGTSNGGNGINVAQSNYNSITGNVFESIDADSTSPNYGILIADSDYNTITANVVSNNNNAGSSTGYGLRLISSSDENLVYANSILGNDVNFQDDGTNTFGDSTTNNVS